MDLKLTPENMRNWSDKDSKKPHFRRLYEEHDFLTAYAEHTNLRVADNPKGAIGREDEWESHPVLQLTFLRDQGLTRQSRLLDVGCGVGRFARIAVPYLDPGHYVGVDISPAALGHAEELAAKEGWKERDPKFLLNGDLDLPGKFDVLWAHSVFTHLPPQQIDLMVGNAAKRLSAGGKFLFTYRRNNTTQMLRTGLKQFAYAPVFFSTLAAKHGFDSKPLVFVFPATQHSMLFTRQAGERDDEE